MFEEHKRLLKDRKARAERRGRTINYTELAAEYQTLPDDYYEAAAIEGANSWDVFWRIKLPLLRPQAAELPEQRALMRSRRRCRTSCRREPVLRTRYKKP